MPRMFVSTYDWAAAYEYGIAISAATQEFQLASDGVGQVVQPAMTIEGIVEGQRRDISTVADKRFREMRPDKAVRTRYQDFLALIAHDQASLVRRMY